LSSQRRGRPCRADERATERVEVRLTREELQRVRALATAHGYHVSDMLRLGVLQMADELLEAGEPPIVGGFIRIYCRA
jgi:hypothetical protein